MIKYRTITHLICLLAILHITAAFKFRCWWFCTEQTAVQMDYSEARDDCREYAQLKVETDTAIPNEQDPQTRTGQLLSLFSSCMSTKGWSVPDGQSKTVKKRPTPPFIAHSSTALMTQRQPQAAQQPQPQPIRAYSQQELDIMQRRAAPKDTSLTRASECAFARHGADYSSVSRVRAESCDIECAERLKVNPNSKPAACPDYE